MNLLDRMSNSVRFRARRRWRRWMDALDRQSAGVRPNFNDTAAPLRPETDQSVAKMSDEEFDAALRSTGVHVGPPPRTTSSRGWRKRRRDRRALEFIADLTDGFAD